MAVGHCAINLSGWGLYKSCSSSMVKSLWRSRGLATWKLQRICILSKSRSIIAQQYVDGYALFHVHCSKKSQENPKGPKFSILKFFIRKKCVCSIVPALQYFSNLKGSNLRVTDQCQDQPSTLQLSDFSQNVLFSKMSWAQRHLGLCVNVS